MRNPPGGRGGPDVHAFFASGRGQPLPWAAAQTFQTRIRRNIRLAEAPSFGQSIFQYAPGSHGAEDYQRLAEEIAAQLTDGPAAIAGRRTADRGARFAGVVEPGFHPAVHVAKFVVIAGLSPTLCA